MNNWGIYDETLTNGKVVLYDLRKLVFSRGYNSGCVKVNKPTKFKEYTEFLVIGNDTNINGVAPNNVNHAVELFNNLVANNLKLGLVNYVYGHHLVLEESQQNNIVAKDARLDSVYNLNLGLSTVVYSHEVKLNHITLYYHSAAFAEWGWAIGFENRDTNTITYLKNDTDNLTIFAETENYVNEMLLGTDLIDLIIPANSYIFVSIISDTPLNEGDITIEGGVMEILKVV